MYIFTTLYLWVFKKRLFEESFGIAFPKTEAERNKIAPEIKKALTQICGEMESAKTELEKHGLSTFSNPNPVTATWCIAATKQKTEKEELYAKLSRLARWAGYSPLFFEKIENTAKEIGKDGGLTFSTGT
ncbi:MAG: hypothetical protein WCX74_02085 [Candidatus Paceibacterota bacterium]